MSRLKNLGPKHRHVILLLATGGTVKAAAAEVGVRADTVSIWKNAPIFRVALAEKVREINERDEQATFNDWAAVRRKALDFVNAVLDDTEADPRVKLGAAKLVFDRTDATKKAIEAKVDVTDSTNSVESEALVSRLIGESEGD